MKKHLFVYPCAFLLLSMTGCGSEEGLKEVVDTTNLPTVVLSAGFGNDTNSRTTIDKKGMVRWNAADLISVNGVVNTKTEIFNEGTNALFTVAAATPYSAVYPSSFSTGYANGTFNVTLPEKQAYTNNTSFSDNENLSVAYSTDTKLQFANTCGLLKVGLQNDVAIDDVKSIRFVSSDNPVSGTFKVTPEKGADLTVVAGNKNRTIEFATPQSISPASDLTVTFVLPPNTYGLGWKFQLLNSKGEVVAEKYGSAPLSIVRSKLAVINVLEFYPPIANSYIVAPGKSVKILVMRANQSTYALDGGEMVNGKYIQLSPTDEWTAEVLPRAGLDTPVTLSNASGKGADGSFTVTAGSTPGNAVVAIKKGGVIQWSWHIWITDYNPNDPATQFKWNNGYNFVFMGRNLGALSNDKNVATAFGLHYQWGRKDPCVLKSDTRLTYQQYTLAQAFRSPGILPSGVKVGMDNVFDWSTSQIDALWGVNSDKSAYDPCPAGWRVPVTKGGYFPFTNMTASVIDGGCQWVKEDPNSFFPCAGYSTSTGSVSSDCGYYWSANPDYNTSSAIRFSATVFGILRQQRAQLNSVRCIQE